MSLTRHHLLLLGALILIMALDGARGDMPSALEYLNAIRAQAGLARLERHPGLQRAAASHANYLALNAGTDDRPSGTSLHAEAPGRPGFTGATAGQRALAAGYPHGQVKENLNQGARDPARAIDNLMSAIYHRLTFLDPVLDEVGVGRNGRSQVFVLGRSDYRQLCEQAPPEALFRTPVACDGRVMTAGFFDELCQSLPEDARFAPPYPYTCPDGGRLNTRYMQRLCRRPPNEALHSGPGRYYAVCEQGHRFRAEWFESFCAAQRPSAIYPFDGRYYEICDNGTKVHAQWLERACARASASSGYQDSGRKLVLCEPPRHLRPEYLEQRSADRLRRQPAYTLWPPAQGHGIPPIFLEEHPDPLPDRSVSGYPISIQFNPQRVATVRLTSYMLLARRGGGWRLVDDIRLLTSANDPNALLSDYVFVLFPLERLDWGTRYRVLLEAYVDQRLETIDWEFTTRQLAEPLLTAHPGDREIAVPFNQPFHLYLKPEGPHLRASTQAQATYDGTVAVQLEVLDPHTLRLEIRGSGCRPVELALEGGRRLRLRSQACSSNALPR